MQKSLACLQGQSRLCCAVPWATVGCAAAAVLPSRGLPGTSCHLASPQRARRSLPFSAHPQCPVPRDFSKATAQGTALCGKPRPQQPTAIAFGAVSCPAVGSAGAAQQSIRPRGGKGAVFRGAEIAPSLPEAWFPLLYFSYKIHLMDFIRGTEHLHGILQKCFLTWRLCLHVPVPTTTPLFWERPLAEPRSCVVPQRSNPHLAAVRLSFCWAGGVGWCAGGHSPGPRAEVPSGAWWGGSAGNRWG